MIMIQYNQKRLNIYSEYDILYEKVYVIKIYDIRYKHDVLEWFISGRGIEIKKDLKKSF